jgi:hypothetical protein
VEAFVTSCPNCSGHVQALDGAGRWEWSQGLSVPLAGLVQHENCVCADANSALRATQPGGPPSERRRFAHTTVCRSHPTATLPDDTVWYAPSCASRSAFIGRAVDIDPVGYRQSCGAQTAANQVQRAVLSQRVQHLPDICYPRCTGYDQI